MAVAYDTFTGTSGTSLGSHTADSGQSWTLHDNGFNLDGAGSYNGTDASGFNDAFLGFTPATADYQVGCVAPSGAPSSGNAILIRAYFGGGGTQLDGYRLSAGTTGFIVEVLSNYTPVGAPLANLTGTFDPHFVLRIQGSLLTVFSGGVQVWTGSDSTWSGAGSAGLVTYGSGTGIRDFTVGDIPSLVVTSPASIIAGSTGNTIVLTGTNTAFASGFSGAIVASGGNITAQVIDSPAQITLAFDAPASGPSVAFADPTFATSATLSVTGSVAVPPPPPVLIRAPYRAPRPSIAIGGIRELPAVPAAAPAMVRVSGRRTPRRSKVIVQGANPPGSSAGVTPSYFYLLSCRNANLCVED